MSESRLPGCFKYGCIGCLTLFAVGMGLTFLATAIQFTADVDPKPEQRQAERQLPEPPTPPQPPEALDPETPTIDGDRPPSVTLDPTPALGPDQGVGTLVLDLRMGDFIVRPGPADQPLRVEADFDSANFELEEDWEQGGDGDWTYKVSFGAKGGFFGMLFGGGGEIHNQVKITVPRGHPMRIVGSMKMGESKVDLGGLWLESYDLEYGMGDHFVEVREPLPFPMESFVVDSSMGELEIRGLGDASPRQVEVEHGMGDFFLDLKGAWRRDATVEASFSMGAFRLWVPEDTFVDVEGGSVGLGESSQRLPDTSELPEDSPRLTLDVSGSMGELEIEY